MIKATYSTRLPLLRAHMGRGGRRVDETKGTTPLAVHNMFIIRYRSLPCPADEVEDDVARGVAGQGLPYEEPQPIGIRSSNS